MRAIIKSRPEPGVDVGDVPVPLIGGHDVLLEVKVASICGSDLGIYDYTPAYHRMKLPVILGHEFSGRIAEVGTEVEDFDVGDRVLSQSVVSCGACSYCQDGMDNLCEDSRLFGIHRDGGFAEYVAVPFSLLHRVPESLSYEEAALVEPLSNAIHFVRDITSVKTGDLAVVLGVGPIGLLSAQLFRLGGAEVLITGVSVDTERFKIAERLGLETVNVDEEDPVKIVLNRTNSEGADTAYVAVGAASAMVQALELVKKRGQVTVVGIFPGMVEVPLTRLVRREIVVKGAYDARRQNFEQAIKMMEDGAVNAADLITHRFPLEEADEAFGVAKSKVGCKVLFIPS
jgi:L-iditol 2-dehydrogenase